MGSDEVPRLNETDTGAERFVVGRDEAPILKYFILTGLSSISFWISLQWAGRSPGLVAGTILKYVFSLSVIVWLNSIYYLKNNAQGVVTESFEFQREQIKLTLWVFGWLIVPELPMWLASV